MILNEIQIRVRYAETDQMGYVYYGNYAAYFEVARVETLRNLGFSYRKLEEEGIMLPVLDYSIKYMKPAFYDDVLTIRTTIDTLPAVRICFKYETFNENKEMINRAETTLVFIHKSTGKPCAMPDDFREAVKSYF